MVHDPDPRHQDYVAAVHRPWASSMLFTFHRGAKCTIHGAWGTKVGPYGWAGRLGGYRVVAESDSAACSTAQLAA